MENDYKIETKCIQAGSRAVQMRRVTGTPNLPEYDI